MPAVASRQLAFPLGFAASFAREDFVVAPCNAQAHALVARWPDWPAHAAWLAGPAGCGKSHLAAIWADEAGARIVAGRALDVAAVPGTLATGALVVEAEAGALDEAALFHLLNLAREEGASVLFTARLAPSLWGVKLADLASRLRAMPGALLAEPDDASLAALLVKLFADRQIAADDALVAYLTARIERSFAAAQAVVATLDREGLRLRRPVSRALAADVLRKAE